MPCAGGRGSLPGLVCLLDETLQANYGWHNFGRGPHLFRKGKAGVSTMKGVRYRANCLLGLRECFKRDTVDLVPGATERAGF